MLETPHVIVGAAIATKVVNPALALPLAFGSHFILERVPHWNPHLNTEKNKFGKITVVSTKIVILDVVLSLVGGFYIASRVLPDTGRFITILAACILAALPDLIEGPYFFLNMKSKLIERWIAFQKSLQVDTGIFTGLLTQLITVIATFWWILG
ncbi:hypothetical protein A2955_04155 [Candidatus Woesebacteria bacterium RIFCSPLOWO2_01_FULL_37_19]|uniref:Uncharacterized protein n=2 Tax=Candidatus Woeseibacteriota TaxID=1752722 RepID=A0A1F8B0G7_9BACT|nr:MAG: hypothetical protein A2771_01180 [Candidatus Woesebacteria bacterium RIFCSPHIGHO2_01_FULL_38_26b]OGM57513.1 MAG: hypothetical protein A2955_04155 [Candidatus Woesebacteria bacterium RIFCSPLOWO2_01_FULL_37_19]